MLSITLTNGNTVAENNQSQTVSYTSDEPASLDRTGVMCESLCGMAMPEQEREE